MINENKLVFNQVALLKKKTKLFGLQWQEAHSKDVSGEYRVWFPRGTMLGQCACLYTWAELIVHYWWVRNRCESKKRI